MTSLSLYEDLLAPGEVVQSPETDLQYRVERMIGAGGFGQGRQLAHGVLGVEQAAGGVHADQHHVLEAQLAVLDLGDVLQFGGEPADSAQGVAVFTFGLFAVVVAAVEATAGRAGREGLRRSAGKEGVAGRTALGAGQHARNYIVIVVWSG